MFTYASQEEDATLHPLECVCKQSKTGKVPLITIPTRRTRHPPASYIQHSPHLHPCAALQVFDRPPTWTRTLFTLALQQAGRSCLPISYHISVAQFPLPLTFTSRRCWCSSCLSAQRKSIGTQNCGTECPSTVTTVVGDSLDDFICGLSTCSPSPCSYIEI